jgi:hydroxymethylbilane synthase
MMRLRIATRGSTLALTQAGMVARALAAAAPGVSVELLPVRTSGDVPGSRGGDKLRFVKEVEDALLAGEADLAVHSAKDVPGELPAGLHIAAVPERADPRDALCGAESLDALPYGARVGTSSLRRRAQLLALRPDLRMLELRGNVDTRLARLREGRYDAVILAAAGLGRLGFEVGVPLPATLIVPAAGQGCLALEARTDDGWATTLARRLDHPRSRRQLAAERAVARRLGADCSTPFGAYARPVGRELELSAFAGRADGTLHTAACVRGADPETLGAVVADALFARGAGEVLGRAA